jgi:hypothetical protein
MNVYFAEYWLNLDISLSTTRSQKRRSCATLIIVGIIGLALLRWFQVERKHSVIHGH